MGILGSSKHPILVKKISLRLWSLRDEIECIINKRIESLSDKQATEVTIEDLKKEYSLTQQPTSQTQEIVSQTIEGEDNGEDEMMKALALANDNTDETLENNEQSLEGQDISNKTHSHDSDETDTLIRQRFPTLPSQSIVSGISFLSEITMDEMFLFTSKHFLIGQNIVLEFLIPRHFCITATVFYCRLFNMKSRIISHNKLPYRLGIKFHFERPGERSILREFLQSVEPDLSQLVPVTTANQNDDDDDDDFAELDDIEL